MIICSYTHTTSISAAFSHSCAVCPLQIAPIYKQMAEQYKDKAVFAKVDINANHQTASAQQIRSMPTFQLYLFGKKRDQFSGADTNRIQNMMGTVCRMHTRIHSLASTHTHSHTTRLMRESDMKTSKDYLMV